MWLAHHFPEDYERCTVIGRRHVCRRCSVLYPTAFAVMFLTLGGLRWPEAWDVVLVPLLALPAFVEFMGEHLRDLPYRPRRQVLLTVPMAVAAGVGLARYLEDQTDPVFWITVAVYGGLAVLAVWVRHRRDAEGSSQEPHASA
jgi:hypothetical protein